MKLSLEILASAQVNWFVDVWNYTLKARLLSDTSFILLFLMFYLYRHQKTNKHNEPSTVWAVWVELTAKTFSIQPNSLLHFLLVITNTQDWKGIRKTCFLYTLQFSEICVLTINCSFFIRSQIYIFFDPNDLFWKSKRAGFVVGLNQVGKSPEIEKVFKKHVLYIPFNYHKRTRSKGY